MAIGSRILKKANQRISVGGAATLLVATTMIGQVLGFLRVKFINSNFDALGPHSTDAFFAAFKIPDFFFYTVAAGALGVAFIPVLADRLEVKDRKGAWELASSLLNLMTLLMLIVGVILFIFAEPLISHIVAPDMEPQQLHNAVVIMRLISFNPLLFTLTGILTATQQTMGRFFYYAIAPILYNSSIIISALVFSELGGNNGGPFNIGLVGLGLGALIGALLQLFIVLVGMKGIRLKWKPKIVWSNPFKQVLIQLPPRSIDQGMDAINSIVETNFARRLGTGYLSYYENAYILHTAPILLIGSAISTAAFPRMTETIARGQKQLFRKEFLQILRIMIWITVPVVTVAFFTRGYLARVIFSRDAPEIAAIFGFLCVAIFFRIMYTIISRYFYAHKDTWTPLVVSILAISLNVVLSWQLSKPYNYGVSGLAMAQSIVAIVEVSILSTIMIIKDSKLFDREFWGGIWQIVSITGFSIVTAYVSVKLLPLQASVTGFAVIGFKLAIITILTFSVHLGLSYMFGLSEAEPVIKKMKKVAKAILRPVHIGW